MVVVHLHFIPFGFIVKLKMLKNITCGNFDTVLVENYAYKCFHVKLGHFCCGQKMDLGKFCWHAKVTSLYFGFGFDFP